jgi:hypothetical protein
LATHLDQQDHFWHDRGWHERLDDVGRQRAQRLALESVIRVERQSFDQDHHLHRADRSDSVGPVQVKISVQGGKLTK